MPSHSKAVSILNQSRSGSESAFSLHEQTSSTHGLSFSGFSSDDTLNKYALRKGSRAKRWKRPTFGLAIWKRLSTRTKIFVIGALILALALGLGLGVGLPVKEAKSKEKPPSRWKPAIGNTWQIQLNGPLTSMTVAAHNYDIDLFENNETTIKALHRMNAKVICYFSAGTYEDGRPDASAFAKSSVGSNVVDWAGEKWLDIRSASVRSVMAARIKLAKEKGCDGVDPDNVDGYSRKDTGFRLTKGDAIKYLQFLAGEAHSRGLAIGLKNSAELASSVMDHMDWDICESCVVYNECRTYQPFIMAGRPVFHIEYVDGDKPVNLTAACNAPGTRGFSTLLKRQNLDEWFLACPLVAA